jgi:hypothetical protein
MENEFQNKWKRKLEEEREKVLSWERLFLPPVPEELTEKSVTLYIKQIKPQLRRANNRFLRFISWVLVELVFGGLVVLGSFGVFWAWYSLPDLIDEGWSFLVRAWVISAILERAWAISAICGIVFLIVLVLSWLGRIIGVNDTHPAEIVKRPSKALEKLESAVEKLQSWVDRFGE